MAHSNFFQDALRSRIPHEVRRMNSVQPERLEPECDHGACCFRRKTLSPVRNANPIAELSTLVRRRDHQTDGAAEFAARRNRDGKRRRTSRAKFFLSVLQKTLRVVSCIGMRNVRGRSGNFARSCKPHDGGEVAAFERTQQQSRSAQFLRRGHAIIGILGFLPLSKKGKAFLGIGQKRLRVRKVSWRT